MSNHDNDKLLPPEDGDDGGASNTIPTFQLWHLNVLVAMTSHLPWLQARISQVGQCSLKRWFPGKSIVDQHRTKWFFPTELTLMDLSLHVGKSLSWTRKWLQDRCAIHRLDCSLIIDLLKRFGIDRPPWADEDLCWASALRRPTETLSHGRRTIVDPSEPKKGIAMQLNEAVLLETVLNEPTFRDWLVEAGQRFAQLSELDASDLGLLPDMGRVANQMFDEIDFAVFDAVPESGIAVAGMLFDAWNLHGPEFVIVREAMIAGGHAPASTRSVF